jgi:hypothetical protein
MCTFIDKNATKKFRDSLKSGRKYYAWKVVISYKGGGMGSPFQNYIYSPKKNEIACPRVFNEDSIGFHSFSDGVFHCFRTRKQARLALKNYFSTDNYFCGDKEENMKVVKVEFEKDDFVVIGECGEGDRKEFGLENEKNEAICITGFTFAK